MNSEATIRYTAAVEGPNRDGGLRPDLIVIGSDYKAAQWAKESAVLGCTVVPVKSAGRALKVLMRAWRDGRRPAVMFRYLNDVQKLGRTFVKFATEAAVVIATVASGARLFWLCHNVDRETDQHYPWLTFLRRQLIGAAADKIFVSDPLLVEPAKRLLPDRWSKKIDWLCFGPFESWGELEPWGSETESVVRHRVDSFVTRIRRQARVAGTTSLIGLCLSRPGAKYVHYDYAKDLLSAAQATPFHVGLIMAVDMRKATGEAQRRRIAELRDHENVLLFERAVGFHEVEMASNFDFFWRGCTDWSTPVTVYGAANVGKPILAIGGGFLDVLVESYDLGAVVRTDMADLEGALTKVRSWDGGGTKRFLSARGWSVAADRLTAALACGKRASDVERCTHRRDG